MKRLPDSIFQVLKSEYESTPTTDGKKVFGKAERIKLVKKSKAAYDGLSQKEKADVFVPESDIVLDECPIKKRDSELTDDEYEFNYMWPSNDGFVKDEFSEEDGVIKRQNGSLQEGMLYDRLGELSGHYLSPFIDGRPQSYESRAMPYYIPEKDFTKNPSYHILKAESTYKPKPGETIDFGNVANAYTGVIGKSTGGTQLFLHEEIEAYLKRAGQGSREERRVLVEQKRE